MTQTPVPERPTLFSPDEIDAFARDGFVVCRGMFGPGDMARIAGWTDELASYPEVPGKYMMYFEESRLEPHERILCRVENFYPYHEGFRYLMDGELRDRTAELLGEPAVLFKDKVNFKMPGAAGFTPHQDMQAGWETYAGFFVTALVSIDEATEENGCLELVAGRHREGLIGDLWKPLSDGEIADMDFVSCPTKPGDVVFFDSWTPHRSAPNMTDSPRRVLYITYNRLADGDHRAQYYADKRRSYPPDCERDPDKSYEFKV